MALVLKDRVKETCTSPGTGSVTLLGASTGYVSFSVIGNGNTTYYTIADQTGNNWEVGIGTYTSSGTTLSRDTVLSNSLGTTAKINFSSGTQDVFVTYPSGRSVYADGTTLTATNSSVLPIASGGTNSTATATAGGVGYGTGTAHAYTTAGTAGQALISAGASAPSFGTLGVAGGGTGQTTYTNGQLLIGNTTGNTLTKSTLTAGSGITITNGTGSITIAASGGSGGGQQNMAMALYPTTAFNATGSSMVNTGTGTFTWTCPTGVTKVTASVIAGGGGSDNACNNGGHGGVAIGIYTVVPGTAYTITVGAGGAGSTSGSGTSGGSSSFSSFCSATGGPGSNPVSGAGTGGNIRNIVGSSGVWGTAHAIPVTFSYGAVLDLNTDTPGSTAAYAWATSSKSNPGNGGGGAAGGVSGVVVLTWVG